MEQQTEKSEILNCFTDDFNPMVFLAKAAGADVAERFMEYCGGTKPHIPTKGNFWQSLETQVRDETIRTRFNGENYGQLALEYELSDRHIRNIVHKEQRPQFRQVDNAKALRFRPDVVETLNQVAARYGNNVSPAAVANVIVQAAAQLPEVKAALDAAFDTAQATLFEDAAA